MTGYASGLRDKRVKILNRTDGTAGTYGQDSGGVDWTEDAEVWASVDFVRGKRAMNEGALDVYAVEMVRMNWNDIVNVRSRIVYGENTYQILGDTFHSDKQMNIIQFHMQMIIE